MHCVHILTWFRRYKSEATFWHRSKAIRYPINAPIPVSWLYYLNTSFSLKLPSKKATPTVTPSARFPINKQIFEMHSFARQLFLEETFQSLDRQMIVSKGRVMMLFTVFLLFLRLIWFVGFFSGKFENKSEYSCWALQW